MGAVGGVAILGGNFEAATFPEDKVVQRSLTAGTQESSPIDAVILDALPLGAPGQLDSHAFIWKGHSNDGSPHTIDWKLFVDVTADDGTGSVWTLQTRIDAAPYGTVMTIDDNGLLTVSGATFTMDQLIIDADNTEAVLIRKDGDAGDVFIVDTVNDVVRLASNDTFLTFGASSDARLERFGPRDLGMREPGVGGVALGAGGENTFRIYARDDVSAARFLELTGDGPTAVVKANRFAGGGQFDLFIDVTVGRIAFFNENVQRWNIQGSVTADFEFAPFITNRYDLGSASFAVRNLYTNGVLIGQDQTSAYDAITIGATDLIGDGQQDSGAVIWTGKGFETATPHDIDWKAFVDVTADDGTGSIWTLQARIDAASFVDEFTITATTSPTLVNIGPGSTGGALAFGPLGSDGPAQSGTVRLKNADSLTFRNANDSGDLLIISFGSSNIMQFGEAGLERIDFPSAVTFAGEIIIDHDGSALSIRNTSSNRVFDVSTSSEIVTVGFNLDRSAAVVDRFRLLGSNLSVNSTVGFSGAILLEGQAREAGGSLHDATWRMYVEPLTTTAFDGQSVFKITAEIDTGGPTTVFTLTDTGDLIVPGSFTIDGLIIDVSSPEAFLVRKDGDSGDVFVIDTDDNEVKLFGVLSIGSIPATSGSIRLSYVDNITFRNNNNSGNLTIVDFGDSNEMDFGDSAMPIIRIHASRLESNRLRITHTQVAALEVNNDSNAPTLVVDTSNEITRFNSGEMTIDSEGLQGTDANAFIRLDQAALVAPGFSDSPPYVFAGRSFNSGAHTREFRTFVDMTSNAGDGNWVLQTRLDAGSNVQLVIVPSNGRFAITQPEQVSIGSPTFIDNVQVHITGSFVDDYGGGPTETHKLRITGSQTGDSGRTSRQTIFDLSNASIITQNLSQTIAEVGGMSLNVPSITPGTDTITVAYNLKLRNSPSEGTENYVLLVDDSTGAADALVRIGKSGQTGLKLLVGGGAGAENLDGNAQMRLTNFFSPDGTADYAALLHVHSTLQATDGTTDHITGTFFEGTLRTQVEADENVANISQVRIDEPNIQDNLTGTGEITNAQSLLITGAPTEGESNYALRILGGDLQLASSAALLFRNDSDDGDLTILSIGGTDFLEIGGPGSADVDRINLYANGFVRANTDALVLKASAADHGAETRMQQTFADVATTSGSSVTAVGLIPAGSFVIGVTVRTLSAIGGPASFDVGDGIDVDRWGASIGSGSNTATDIEDFTTGAVTTFPAANDVVITSTGVDFTSGSIRITVHYTTLLASAQ